MNKVDEKVIEVRVTNHVAIQTKNSKNPLSFIFVGFLSEELKIPAGWSITKVVSADK